MKYLYITNNRYNISLFYFGFCTPFLLHPLPELISLSPSYGYDSINTHYINRNFIVRRVCNVFSKDACSNVVIKKKRKKNNVSKKLNVTVGVKKY